MSSESNSSDLSETFNLDRSKALADGVFAIVVTLLVLGIDVPSDHNFSEDGLLLFLQRIGFHVFTYAISFWLAATYWLQHSAIMQYYRHGNRTVVWLNLLFLFPVTLLPFVTELRTDYRYEALVTLLFGLLQIFIGLVLVALWNYAVSHPHLLTRRVGEDIRRTTGRPGPGVFPERRRHGREGSGVLCIYRNPVGDGSREQQLQLCLPVTRNAHPLVGRPVAGS